MNLNQKGMTLVELLIVVIVIGVIASVSIPAVGRIVENTQIRADQATVLGMNQATYYYALTNPNHVQAFANMETNEERIQTLLNNGFLSSEPRSQHSETVYVFDEEHLLWCRNSCSAISGVIDFSSPSFSLTDYPSKTGSPDHFSVVGTSLVATPPVNNDDIIFFTNPQSDYQINLTFAIGERVEGGVFGGLGVLFETILESNNPQADTGYILQFDRHIGQVLIRHRNRGNEGHNSATLLRYDVVLSNEDTSQPPIFVERPGNDTNFNSQFRNHPWWSATHSLTMKVETVGNQKTLNVRLNNQSIFSWTIPEPIESESASLNHTGFRAWYTVEVTIFSFSITD